ncbi:C40 family peptidase [Thermosyntropha sp.]|uniref:C40 family peptidase n=1 Tax=Thermosyntropha sp. TaxID=2740820 RepID=UPI0025FACE49|nr:C40 family peptidase [Thermosyntropha sp.]MBO8158532.1 LysM peptidoglycan-binding domain-containing protein [Thermosyntropha sp.]
MRKFWAILIVSLAFIIIYNTNLMAADVTYVVKSGDSLWKIAVNNGTTVDKLKQLNNLTSDLLFPGQVLLLSKDIPTDKEISLENNNESTDDQYSVYKVQPGDSLWKIARENGMDIESLKKINNLNSDNLNIGDKLLVIKKGEINNTVLPSRSGLMLTGERIIEFAASYLGTPYRYGGNAPGGFDCSGFVQYIFGQFGYRLPRTAADQYQCGIWVDKNDLIPGDLVFFTCYSRGIDHVGIYAGEGKFIHSSSPRSGGVIYSSLSESYYVRSYAGAKRLIR